MVITVVLHSFYCFCNISLFPYQYWLWINLILLIVLHNPWALNPPLSHWSILLYFVTLTITAHKVYGGFQTVYLWVQTSSVLTTLWVRVISWQGHVKCFYIKVLRGISHQSCTERVISWRLMWLDLKQISMVGSTPSGPTRSISTWNCPAMHCMSEALMSSTFMTFWRTA